MFEITLTSFIRIVTVGFLAYVGLIILLRASGKRTLTKLNAFDLVVTVALGSTLATILLDSSISLLEGMTAFALLIFLQYLLTFFSVHSKWVNNVIKSEPRLLFLDGSFLRKAMKKERIKEMEILQAIRNTGFGSTEKVKAVVLETDGSLSVISSETGNALENVNSES
ncbi:MULTISPECIES: YetF domain-containing protein [Planococcus]|uniref:DUF421 domain-containing protein n=2 Tax=Planococcus faecalis TaxID=1598147 RepID=A0ABN4XLL5_9BACL|nr:MULTISPECIES: YetF domain-containing protein [Planococcus]AQU80568.1 hypothetical protein AJGP001_15305 [Planococcus faecalis]MDJ0330138.1 DUF421 domain-containing protein [Planococcus sp. S3-L1]